jgi:hypothetical protein
MCCSPYLLIDIVLSLSRLVSGIKQMQLSLSLKIIIIICPLQSTAGHRPLQFLAISLDLRLIASSSCQPFCANRHSTWPEGVLHYVCRSLLQNSFTPAVIGSTSDMASPLPLQHANMVCYFGDFSSLLVSDSYPQRNHEHSSFHSPLCDLELWTSRAVSLGSVCPDP